MMNLENLLKKHNFLPIFLVIIVLLSFIGSVFGVLNDSVFWTVALISFIYIKVKKKKENS